ncbi:hypothetical protein PPL19_19887 [Pseudomonas psychrotolerans L19]|nr:hypothetical protein PPL19_19887 [Pseudomonas psychrotolerans L19]
MAGLDLERVRYAMAATGASSAHQLNFANGQRAACGCRLSGDMADVAALVYMMAKCYRLACLFEDVLDRVGHYWWS